MRERGIAGVTRRRRRGLTREARRPVFVPDLIGRDFTAPRPGVRSVGDMTCLPVEENWLYLATAIGLATRGVVGRLGRPPPRRAAGGRASDGGHP